MKTSLAVLTAVFTTLCSVSTALGQTPPPASDNAPQLVIPNMPQLYYSVTRDAVAAPMITTPPKDIDILQGKYVLFKIEFSGIPTPTVYSSRDGMPINFSRKRPDGRPVYEVYSGAKWFVLSIRQVQPEDSGKYQFKVRNDVGVATASAILRVSKQ